MYLQAKLSTPEAVLPLRARQRQELNNQIVHDSIHRRQGWSLTYLLDLAGVVAGFGSIAIGGPWKDKPTVFEFYLLPGHRTRAFDLFEALLTASGARFFEAQSDDVLIATMVLTYGRDISIEKIVFDDQLTTALPANGAALRRVTSEEEILACMEKRQGGGEWLLEVEGNVAGKGGILF